ncbi:hypothetical protein KM043_004195 [Ampulex compressa]|nr:hypothetical protein KM043_004195 [Ampulex compressa]
MALPRSSQSRHHPIPAYRSNSDSLNLITIPARTVPRTEWRLSYQEAGQQCRKIPEVLEWYLPTGWSVLPDRLQARVIKRCRRASDTMEKLTSPSGIPSPLREKEERLWRRQGPRIRRGQKGANRFSLLLVKRARNSWGTAGRILGRRCAARAGLSEPGSVSDFCRCSFLVLFE